MEALKDPTESLSNAVWGIMVCGSSLQWCEGKWCLSLLGPT